MKIKLLLLSTLLLAASFSLQAINVGAVTVIMGTESKLLSKEIENTNDVARFVSVSVSRISSPMADGVVIPMESKSELLSTPASLILPGNTKENFRFIYNGPADNKERYYRLAWTDDPITELGYNTKKKVGEATTSAIINTILVVAPRNEKFDFSRQADTVYNNGNASFRVVSFGPCKDKNKDSAEGCRERYYVMPGMSARIKHTDLSNKKTRIGIWHGEQYINVN